MVCARRDFPLNDPHCMECGASCWESAAQALDAVHSLIHRRVAADYIVRGEYVDRPRGDAATTVRIREYMVCGLCGAIHFAWGGRFHLPPSSSEPPAQGDDAPPRALRPVALTRREAWVLEQRYRAHATYSALATQLGCTAQRVRQIERRGIMRLLDAVELQPEPAPDSDLLDSGLHGGHVLDADADLGPMLEFGLGIEPDEEAELTREL
jgi:hypothetical protein